LRHLLEALLETTKEIQSSHLSHRSDLILVSKGARRAVASEQRWTRD
jgi:hypothetical protein